MYTYTDQIPMVTTNQKSVVHAQTDEFKHNTENYQSTYNVNCCSHSGKQYRGSFLKKLKILIDLPYNPVISLLGIYIQRKRKH